MNTLALCAALNNSYLAYEFQNDFYSEIIKSDENYHSLYLIPKIKKLIDDKKINLKELDLIVVNCGPGSFTGIRVALSIAKVMAGELNLPLVGLNSAEILLKAYDKKVLIMDARRDMFFFATKDDIKLVYKEKIKDYLKDIDEKDILVDKRCFEEFSNALCFEEVEKDLGKVMIELGKEKFENEKDKSIFNYMIVNANYIQTPPVV